LQYHVTGQAVRQEERAGYLPHIDGLRAVAIISVLGFHAMPSHVPGGFVGVDIFFVISGFLITSILRKQISDRTFSFSDFLARRERRIVPALACVALVSLIAADFILSPEQMSEFGRSLATTALFGANFHFYRTTDYFALPAQEQPLLHA
jgi:peptidoglycan/LPS O-acetylase OafA/YrhL